MKILGAAESRMNYCSAYIPSDHFPTQLCVATGVLVDSTSVAVNPTVKAVEERSTQNSVATDLCVGQVRVTKTRLKHPMRAIRT